jgi:DNA repair exonuclease SbcCD ATPase subunit
MNEEMRGSSSRMSGLKQRLEEIENRLAAIETAIQSDETGVDAETLETLKAMAGLKSSLEAKIHELEEQSNAHGRMAQKTSEQADKMTQAVREAEQVVESSKDVPEEIREATNKVIRIIDTRDFQTAVAAAGLVTVLNAVVMWLMV